MNKPQSEFLYFNVMLYGLMGFLPKCTKKGKIEQIESWKYFQSMIQFKLNEALRKFKSFQSIVIVLQHDFTTADPFFSLEIFL